MGATPISMPRRIIKNNITVLRRARRMRQLDLARRLHLHQSEVSLIERGEREPGVRLAKRIAKALRSPVEDVF